MLRMRDFEQKSDPSALFETHIQAIKNMNDKISTLERSLVIIKNKKNKLIQDYIFQNKKVNEISEGKDKQIQEIVLGSEQIDPHKVCALEADIRRAQEEVTEHRNLIKSIQLVSNLCPYATS